MRTLIHIVFRKICNRFAGTGIGMNKFVAEMYHFILPLIRPNSIMVDEHKMFLDRNDSLALSIFGRYEPEVSEVIKKEVKRGSTVLDIGANIGYFTLMMAECVDKKGRVYAFEPDPENYKLLEKNIKINGFRNVIPVNAAISDMKGKINLYIGSESAAEHSIYNFFKEDKKIIVDSWNLDEYFKPQGRKIDFIKIDIQGAEGEALSGMKNIIRKNPKMKILTEIWPRGLSKSKFGPDEYLDMLESFGFKFCLLKDSVKYPKGLITRVGLVHQFEKSNSVNVLCFRNQFKNT